MKSKALLLVLFVAGAFASFALADDGHGKSGDKRKDGNTVSTETRKSESGDKAKNVVCRPSIELELRGTVAAAPASGSVAVLVAKGGAQGASLAGKQLTLDTTSLRKAPTLATGAAVQVHARACVDLVAGTVKLVASEIETKQTEAPKTTTSTTSSTTASSTTTTTTASTTTTTVAK